MKKFVQWFTLFLLILSGRSALAQDVLTQHNDLARTGWNPNETTLNINNVNKNTFGLAYTLKVDERINAQPLVVNGVNIPNVGIKNIVYVATLNNTIYAFDADVAGAPYWQMNYTNIPLTGSRVLRDMDIHPSLCSGYYNDFVDTIGIVGTPVIDKTSGTMYFVTKIVNGTPDNHTWQSSKAFDEYSYSPAPFHQYLHAIDISTGAEKPNSPAEITATYPGTGDGGVSNIINFDPRRQLNRCALALSNGIVYIAFAAHCDFNPSHGWLLGYNATTLQRQIVYNATPNDGRGGIWMSGAGPAIDENGNIYFAAGNGLDEDGTSTEYHKYSSDPSDPANRGESIIKLTPNTLDATATAVTLSSYFTPFDYKYLDDVDLDFPIQTLLVPSTTMLITGCKDDSIYVMDRNNLGGFNANKNNVLQAKFVGDPGTMHSSFAYFGGANPLIYQWSENTDLQAFPVLSNSLGNPTHGGGTVPGPNGQSGAYLSVSSDGTDPATAILWASHYQSGCNANAGTCPIILRAFKASNVATELWNNQMNPTDNVGYFSKMVCPTIANGKVYEPTGSYFLAVYGLKNNTTCVTNVASGKAATASSSPGNASKVTDGNTGTSWTSSATDDQYIYIDLASRYDFCRVLINWVNTNALNFNIDVSEDAITWTNVDSVVGNASTITDFYGSFTGRYVRMHGKKLTGSGGYSISEFQIFGQPASSCAPPSNLAVPNPGANSATINWNAVSGATQYLVQYKPRLISSWISRIVSANSITLSALSCNATYDVRVQTVCGSAAQSSISAAAFIAGSCTVTGCSPPTRNFNADIGDIGIAGSTCFQNEIYTLNGSGSDIGGNSDEFQFAFTNPTGIQEVYGQILSQDNLTASNKAGIMIRDSLTNTSRFAYLASVSNGRNIIFEYRSTTGGPASTIIIASNVSLPYWVKIAKSGTTYAPFISTDGSSWTQASGAIDLGFGNDSNPPSYGMAVTSADNSLLSTAQFGSFSIDANSIPLPIQLVNFTAQNINNDHVLISWSTTMEQNVNYFEVQRSADGNLYQALKQVKSTGNSETLRNYSVEDNQPFKGMNYYRLSEVDSDAKTFLSPVVKVQFGESTGPELRPNPATSYTDAVASSEPILEITLYDILGKELRKIGNPNGATTIRINTSTLGTGVYIVRIKTASKNYQQKLFKQ